MMKKYILVLVVFLLSMNSFSQKKPKIKGDKNVVTTTNVIEKEFNAIEVNDALEVSIVQGNKNKYTLTTDKNIQGIIKFSVNDSVLKIYTINKITSSKEIEINLSFINLEHIIIKNDAKIEGEGSLKSKVMYLNAYNSSKFDLDIETEQLIITMQRNARGKLKARSINTTVIMNDRTDLDASITANKATVTLTKSAQLNLKGESDAIAFNLKDNAKLDARTMKASTADLFASNNTDVYVYVSKNLEIYAKGKSKIYVFGDPKFEIKGLTDQSKLIKR